MKWTSVSPWRKVDKRLEDSLRMTVKKSLQELSRALNGDNKTEVIPIFNVLTILKNNRRVELKPNVQDLFNLIHTISRELITVIKVVPRLSNAKTDSTGAKLATFYDSISTDEVGRCRLTLSNPR